MFVPAEEMQEHGRVEASPCPNPQVWTLLGFLLCKQPCGLLCSLRLGQHGLCLLDFPATRGTGYFCIQHHD